MKNEPILLLQSVLYLYIGTKIQQKKHSCLQSNMGTTDGTHIAVTESIPHSQVSFQVLFAFIITDQLNYTSFFSGFVCLHNYRSTELSWTINNKKQARSTLQSQSTLKPVILTPLIAPYLVLPVPDHIRPDSDFLWPL